MADRPVIFSGSMVQALIAGRKGMTRRLIRTADTVRGGPSLFNGEWGDAYVLDPGNSSWREAAYPYRVGDRLWVREAWQIPALCDIQFRATDTARIGHWDPVRGPWRSPIHMPRKFSRMTLTVTGVKVERLQEISEEDAKAEGTSAEIDPFWHPSGGDPDSGGRPSYRNSFEWLWGELHGPDAWAANPWVVAIAFTVALRNIDAKEAA